MKIKFKSSISVLFTICCLVVPLQAVQHSPPWADNYDFNFPELPGNLEMDTRPTAYDAAYQQNLMGYDVSANTDIGAQEAYNILPDDSLVSFHTHGDNYRLLFWNGTNLSLIQTSVFGDRVPGVYYLSDFNNGELEDVLFILYAMCHSAEINATYGNFLTM